MTNEPIETNETRNPFDEPITTRAMKLFFKNNDKNMYQVATSIEVLDQLMGQTPLNLTAIRSIGLRLKELVAPEIANHDNCSLRILPLRPSFAFRDTTIAEFVSLMEEAGKVLVANDLDNPFEDVVPDFTAEWIPEWTKTILIQMLFTDWLAFYLGSLEQQDIDNVETALDQMVAMTCNCDSEEGDYAYGVHEALFTHSEQVIFNSYLPELEALLYSDANKDWDPELVESSAYVLAVLGEEKGYFTGVEAD